MLKSLKKGHCNGCCFLLTITCYIQDEETLLHAVGTAAVVVQVTGTNWPKPLYTLLVTGLCRFRIDKIVMEEPYLIAEVTQLDKLAEQGI